MTPEEKKAAADAAKAKADADKKAAADAKKIELLEAAAEKAAAEKAALEKQNASLKAIAEKATNSTTRVKKLGEPFEHDGKKYAFKLERFNMNYQGEMQNYQAATCPDEVKAYLVENKRFGVIGIVKS